MNLAGSEKTNERHSCILTVKLQNTNNLFSEFSVIAHTAPNPKSISEHELASCASSTTPRGLPLQSSYFHCSEFMSNLIFKNCTF